MRSAALRQEKSASYLLPCTSKISSAVYLQLLCCCCSLVVRSAWFVRLHAVPVIINLQMHIRLQVPVGRRQDPMPLWRRKLPQVPELARPGPQTRFPTFHSTSMLTTRSRHFWQGLARQGDGDSWSVITSMHRMELSHYLQTHILSHVHTCTRTCTLWLARHLGKMVGPGT